MRLIMAFLLGAGLAWGQTIDTQLTLDLGRNADGSRLLIGYGIGGAEVKPYILDTGSSLTTTVWARNAENQEPPWWGAHTDVPSEDGSIEYGGDRGYDYYGATAVLKLQSLVSGTSLQMGLATAISALHTYFKIEDGQEVVQSWFPTIVASAFNDSSVLPYDGEAFGDLGADLQTPDTGLHGIVKALTFANGVHRGFSVDGANGKLTLGVTADEIAHADATYAMQTAGDGTYSQFLVLGDYRIGDGEGMSFVGVPTLFDSGTPPDAGAVLFLGSKLNLDAGLYSGGFLNAGVSIELTIGGGSYVLESNGDIQVEVASDDNSEGGILFGLNFFESYKVTYDLENELVALTAVPEPGTCVLVLMGGALALGMCRRRRGRSE